MKLVVFDLDGTLLDTLQDLTNSVNYAMDKLGLANYSAEQVRCMVGNGVAKLMERAVTRDRAELSGEALRLQRSFYLRHSNDNTVPYHGVIDMLRSLKENGCLIAVHTNKDEDAAKVLCLNHFECLVDYVCGTTDEVTKPNPLKIVQLMAKLNADVERTAYCGDSDVDISTAKNLGVECISVLWGFRDREFLALNGAKHFAASPAEVVELVKKLL